MSNREQWNQFVKQNKGSFLQSWQWSQFKESLGQKVWRLQAGGFSCLIVKFNLSLGKSYLYCPRGPVGQGDFNILLDKVKEIAEQENSIFFKIEPEKSLSLSSEFIKSPKQVQPSKTVILDISRSEDELLNQMHKKTRYNIRLAQKKGITTEQSNDKKSLSSFLKLLKETARRDKFFLHYQKMMDVLGEDMVRLFLAKYKNKVVAANLICFFNKAAIYLHGASDYEHRQLMAPYLLQWQIIQKAKEMGFKYYDFWGIDQDKWPGVTRFKRGFSGEEVNYPGTYDLVYKGFWYLLYKIARRVRKGFSFL